MDNRALPEPVRRQPGLTHIDDRRDSCANGHGRGIPCAFQRMLMQLMNPQRAETLRNLGWFASEGPRCVVYDCAFARGELNRSAVGKIAISARGRPQPLAPLALTSLVACTGALRRAILRMAGLGDDFGLRLHSAAGRDPAKFAPVTHRFDLHMAKAVQVASSSSAVGSARPTGPGMRPHSSTALRIQRFFRAHI
jgi:hypothetical protein